MTKLNQVQETYALVKAHRSAYDKPHYMLGTPPGDSLDLAIDHLRYIIRYARILGTPVMRSQARLWLGKLLTPEFEDHFDKVFDDDSGIEAELDRIKGFVQTIEGPLAYMPNSDEFETRLNTFKRFLLRVG